VTPVSDRNTPAALGPERPDSPLCRRRRQEGQYLIGPQCGSTCCMCCATMGQFHHVLHSCNAELHESLRAGCPTKQPKNCAQSDAAQLACLGGTHNIIRSRSVSNRCPECTGYPVHALDTGCREGQIADARHSWCASCKKHHRRVWRHFPLPERSMVHAANFG